MGLGASFPDGPAALILTCARGTERALKFELKDLGHPRSQALKGAVAVEGPRALIADANVFSRIASRVLWRFLDVQARDERALIDALMGFSFEGLVDARRTIAVEAHLGRGAAWDNSKYAAQRVKDAVCDRMRARGFGRPSVDTRRPDMRLVLHWEDGRAQLSVDTTGRSLGKRGYRRDGGPAPMRENLAAAILAIGHADVTRPFLDPVCGSGTLGVEQALRSLRRFPGAERDFAFARWRHGPADLKRALTRARERAKDGVRERPEAPIALSDHDPEQVERARAALASLHLGAHVDVRACDVGEARALDRAVVVANPPFGERMGRGEEAEVRALYRKLGDLVRGREGTRLLLFSAYPETEGAVDLGPAKKWALYSGPLETTLHRWDVRGAGDERPRPADPRSADPPAG